MATVRLLIGQQGEVEDWTLEASSGSSEHDLLLMGVARQAEFEPSRVDGFPVSVWVEIPFSVQRFPPDVSDPAAPPPVLSPDL